MRDESDEQCPCCVEEYAPDNRRLKCPHRGCTYAACRACLQRCCLSKTACPSCSRGLPIPWLVEHFDHAFVTRDFKRERRRQLVSQQLPLLDAPVRCLDCLQPRHAGGCAPVDVEAARLLHKTCRVCPGCSALVEKVDDGACDVMHCTRCRTSFRFEGGEIVSNVLHNPDQDVALTQEVGVPPRRDIPCVHLFGEGDIATPLVAPEVDGAFVSLVEALHLLTVHSYKISTNAFSTLRHEFEAGTIDERRWGSLMYRREMANARNYEMATACGCVVDTLMTVLANHVHVQDYIAEHIGEAQRSVGISESHAPINTAVVMHQLLMPQTLSQIREAVKLFNCRSREVADLYRIERVLSVDGALRLREVPRVNKRRPQRARYVSTVVL